MIGLTPSSDRYGKCVTLSPAARRYIVVWIDCYHFPFTLLCVTAALPLRYRCVTAALPCVTDALPMRYRCVTARYRCVTDALPRVTDSLPMRYRALPGALVSDFFRQDLHNFSTSKHFPFLIKSRQSPSWYKKTKKQKQFLSQKKWFSPGILPTTSCTQIFPTRHYST